MSFSQIGDLLKEILQKKFNTAPLNKELQIWEVWPKIVGSEIQRHAQPAYFRHGILFIKTSHAIWSTELQFRSQWLKTQLNQALASEFIKEIRFLSH